MLVLSREVGESITLFLEDGRRVELKLLAIKHKRAAEASIGIEAPRGITILRNELLEPCEHKACIDVSIGCEIYECGNY